MRSIDCVKKDQQEHLLSLDQNVTTSKNNSSNQATMVEQLEFDPAMFGMKSNHGMLRSSAPKSQGSGANAVSLSAEPSGPSGGQGASFEQSNDVRGGQRGGRGAFNRGRGGNRGGRGAGRGAFNGGQRPNDGQPFKAS